MLDVDALAAEIRRVDGSNSLGAGALAEALMPFIERHDALVTRISTDEVEKIILETEPPMLSDRGDKIWTRRMATGLSDLFNRRLGIHLGGDHA